MPASAHSLNTRAIRAALYTLLILLAGVAVIVGTYRGSYDSSWDDLRQSTQRRLEFLSSDLASALDKFDTLPIVLSSHPELVDLLRHADDPRRRQAVNLRLERLARESRVAAIYLMNRDGTTIAASNWNTPSSFVAQNYAFRPYFRDAIAGGIGRFYAIGATTGEPGYFLAHPVRDDAAQAARAAPPGVIAVKISLDDIEANWARSGELLMLADVHGVVFLASRPEWKFRTLDALPAGTRERIRAAQQYGDRALAPLPIERPADPAANGVTRLAIGGRDGARPQWLTVAGERREIGRMAWTLLSFSEVDEIARLARGHAAAAGFAYAFILVGALYARLRRRRDEERRIARHELERASAELEQRIGERTAVLVEANRELAAKIGELGRTQITLRATQDELIQAGKLTVLGQMAASITHEINQPLTALRALNDNAVILLDRGESREVRSNLQVIDGLTRRIAGIVGQLKGFARKDDLKQMPVAVAPVIEAARALLAADARHDGVNIAVGPVAPDIAVCGQAVRIEQVLINLMRNALDAVRDTADKSVHVNVEHDTEWVRITVADAGPGIAPEAMARLFEPFFTTKPAGQGLGLGLAISASIANALGGALDAANRSQGGAVFTLRLPAAVLSADAHAAPRTIG
ncbi:sensor histidine kinase [Piscinibacter sp.]|uniref:sensor histidine kinase n=1 Tax=Piscinibacter sp. TaxID=1903157 RepID=UPI002B839254|nr:ATP-binding protein [Albitalea sp.]HUG22027.1 ATP-binding protein [Albitalea sp.]